MQRSLAILTFFLLFTYVLPAQKVISIVIDGAINAVVAEHIERGIQDAEKENAQCLIIRLNTPGGLLKSTRLIVGHILDSPVPVVVYVSPSGAHAGSAGVFITMAAHIAAMSPGTNIGAAHPVNLQGGMDTTMNTKATNDAIAFIRTIAEKRQRNVEWAEDAVRNSVSITASEAVNQKVVDLLANNMQDLLDQIDGRQVQSSSGMVTLHTTNAVVENLEMSWIEKILNVLSDPNIAYILLMLGFYGILFELYNPGSILPGIIGVLGLILGFYSMHTLPVNYAGLALIIFAIILFLLEIKITSYGMLTIGGIISLALGSIMLFRSGSPFFGAVRLSIPVIVTFVALTALFFLFVVGMGLKAQRAKPVIGLESMPGETGETLETLDPVGTVLFHGEIWQAESISGKIDKGQKIRVTAMKNFKLFVEPLPIQ